MKINKMKILILAMVAGLIMATGCTASQTAKTAETAKVDTSWMFHDIVDAAFVKANIAVPMPENVILIDARPYKGKYVSGYIPGAVSIPFSQFDKNINLLPTDKNALLIYYCQGVKCKLSHKSAKKAEKLGYTNVKVYAKGYPEWISLKGNYGAFEAEHVAKLIADNNTVIVDARPLKTKFVKGHIPTAVSIPFSQFDTLKGKLPRDINTPIVFYCGGLKCRLSHKSAVKAIEMGYTNVKVFDKGYPEWKKMYGASKEAMQVTAGTVEGSIDIKRFKDILEKDPESILLIDVRDKDEFAKGSFKTAVNIPVEDLEPKIKDLSDKKPVVFVCSTGARSGEAFYMVKDVRESLKDVYYVEAEIDFKSDGTFVIKEPK
ncbi:MAG: sulfurtransferase [Desulfobacula sp.]|jgi:rhodanese-related sulfurtransferase|uniref:rhodanese-like domain-containing protein n=1 Tax=Desulfobacula sp. TaxID=2593537 RepID=UPI001DE2959D|nr:sulfurtransferase [Desulfobacula sp.]MBT3484749.1 sulfurtransferase [Desulfobacula sp.]MBT3804379.1 sulfurtransferase [Desulfobacula sp.]MBT4025170.1 sulfurtransferase [Desulfobacula sp.]MBT4198572.1 sulfurtransferase [Desulfobacula sp.]